MGLLALERESSTFWRTYLARYLDLSAWLERVRVRSEMILFVGA